jgi:undecaprenyl-diphosphatase
MARDLTALGGFTALILFGIIATLVLVLKRRRVEALVFGGTLIATQVVASTLKSLISRPRPDFVAHLDLVSSSSFPSGHSTLAPVFYLTLCAIVAAGEPQRSVRVVMMVTALLLVAVIGVSRVYLGVHWPTDVLAGWSLGGAIALAATAVLRHLRLAAAR